MSSWRSTTVPRCHSARPASRAFARARRQRAARRPVEDSVTEARGFVGRLEFGAKDDIVSWCPPASARGHRRSSITPCPTRRGLEPRGPSSACSSSSPPPSRRTCSASFVFVVSDFLSPPPSKPGSVPSTVGGTSFPWSCKIQSGSRASPTSTASACRSSTRRAASGSSACASASRGRGATRHEERLAGLLGGMRSLGIEPVLLASVDPGRVFDAFVRWSAEREGAGAWAVRRAAVIAVAGVAALIVGLGLGQLWVARDGGEFAASPAALVAVTTSITPDDARLRDPVRARADVLVDTTRGRHRIVRLQTGLRPVRAGRGAHRHPRAGR